MVYDELDGVERHEVAEHVKACAECAGTLAEERRLHALLAQAAVAEPPPDLLAACRQDLAAALDREAPAPAAAGPIPADRNRPARAGFWARVRLSPAFATALVAVGFVGGWVAFGSGIAAFRQVAGRAVLGTDAEAGVTNVNALVAEPGSDRVRLSYDTLRRASVEGSVDDPGIRGLLVTTVRDSLNAGLRLDAIDALRRHTGEREVRSALLRAVRQDENAGARLKAIEALKERAALDPEVRTTVAQALLRDRNPGVRIRAIDALAQAHDPGTLALFERLSREDPNDYVRLRSAALAERLTQEGSR
jgi:hypothetical protein